MSTAHATDVPQEEQQQLTGSVGLLAGPLILVGAVVLLLTAAFCHFDNSPRFWHAYLLNASFIGSLSLGGLFFVIAHHLFGGRWGTTVRRLAEVVAGTMWVTAILFAPIAVVLAMGNTDLYPWSDGDYLAAEAVVAAKTPYLNTNFFVMRMVGYFALWLGMVAFFNGSSLSQDESGDVATLRNLQRWSGPAMLLFALSINFAAFDWLMSLDPVWFSTIFGVYYWVGGAIGALATVIIIAHLLQSQGVLTRSITTEHYHDLSKLMFALVVFWGYTAFSQFMLIWYANIPEETGWFQYRQPEGPTEFGISIATGALFVVHLFIPFLGFMSRRIRRNKHLMIGWAVYMLVVHWFDLFYLVMPTLQIYNSFRVTEYPAFPLGVIELACLAGMLAIFAGALLRGLQGKLLLPVRDPRLREALSYHNH